MEVKYVDTPPGIPLRRPRFKGLTDFGLLLICNLYEIRIMWFWYLVQMSLNAILMVVFLWLVMGKQIASSTLFIITGGMTQSLAVSGALSLGQNIGSLKDNNQFEYYASLPVSKLSFLCALTAKALFFALPSLVFTMLFGYLVLGLRFHLHPILPLVILLSGFSLVGLGAFIGFYSRTSWIASMTTQAISPLITYLAPVFIPKEALPVLLQWTSVFIPTTYVARALRASLTGQVGLHTYLDLGVLLLWSVGFLTLVYPKLDWRGKV